MLTTPNEVLISYSPVRLCLSGCACPAVPVQLCLYAFAGLAFRLTSGHSTTNARPGPAILWSIQPSQVQPTFFGPSDLAFPALRLTGGYPTIHARPRLAILWSIRPYLHCSMLGLVWPSAGPTDLTSTVVSLTCGLSDLACIRSLI